MIRLSKLTDYGFVLLTQFAGSDGETWLTARDLSDTTGLPLPTVSKLLKLFSKNGILSAQRGVYGGYRLASHPADVHVLDVIELVDGPIAVTECACDDAVECSIEAHCPTRTHWISITDRIRAALAGLTLKEMAESLPRGSTTADVCNVCAENPRQECKCGQDESLDFSGDRR